jgi:hypothetical protein
MAVNLADMQTVGVVLGSPIAAGAIATQRHAGWFVPLFIVGGILAGVGLGYLTHFVAYRLIRTNSSSPPWKHWLSGIAYLLGPLIFSIGGLAFVMWATLRLTEVAH